MIKKLIEQIEMSDFIDENGHELIHNQAYINLKSYYSEKQIFDATYKAIKQAYDNGTYLFVDRFNRNTGKTSAIVKLAHETGLPILCGMQGQAIQIEEWAESSDFNIKTIGMSSPHINQFKGQDVLVDEVSCSDVKFLSEQGFTVVGGVVCIRSEKRLEVIRKEYVETGLKEGYFKDILY